MTTFYRHVAKLAGMSKIAFILECGQRGIDILPYSEDELINSMRPVVGNTTPLIALAAIDKLELLPGLYTSIMVPQAVVEEIDQGGKI